MIYTRIAKIKNFESLILGRDLDNIFNEGHVYSIEKIMGQIIVKDLGKHAFQKVEAVGIILQKGTYLYTKEENKKIK